MHRNVRLILAIWVPMLLIGHGGGLPCCDEGGVGCRSNCDALCDGTAGGTFEADVVGNCGPSGRVTVSKSEDQCELRIEGDDVGVPTLGSAATIVSAWALQDALQTCVGRRISDTRLAVTCTRPLLSCTAFFIRSDQQCAVDTCNVPLCLGDQVLALGENDCCPTCVITPSDSGGVPFDAGRDAMSEMDSGSEEPTWCDAARTEYQDQYTTNSATWGTCADDGDCSITDIHNDCARHCNVVLNEDIYEGDTCDAGACIDLEERLDDSASGLCGGCASASACPQPPNGEARCVDHQCAFVTTP